MARRCFGYGRWDAPFCFIGPEQGMNNDPKEDDFRLQVWWENGRNELDDAVEYHQRLDSLPLRSPKLNKKGKRKDDWFGEKPNVQSTWARLIHFLYGFSPEHKMGHREFQRRFWGRSNGEVCLIELCGLASHKQSDGKLAETHLASRLKRIKSMLGSQRFVLLYGSTQTCDTAWQFMTKDAISLDGDRIKRLGHTLYVRSTEHPTGNHQSYDKWFRFGEQVRRYQRAL